MKESKVRWITTSAAGLMWGIIVTTATVIQPHMQVYQTIWLATLIVSIAAIALWMTRPDHGRLAEVRLNLGVLRLEKALQDELANEASTEGAAGQGAKHGRLESVA